MRYEIPVPPFARGDVVKDCFDDAYEGIEFDEGHGGSHRLRSLKRERGLGTGGDGGQGAWPINSGCIMHRVPTRAEPPQI
jgi:hypothetical protein